MTADDAADNINASSEVSGSWSRGVIIQILLLALLNLVGAYSRTMLGPVQEAMQNSLGFSDQRIALLQGMALAVPLALMAVPVGILADRASRVKLLNLGLVGVVAANIITAYSNDFGTLLMARCLLGASYPIFGIATYAIASDMIKVSSRGRAAAWLGVGEQCGAPAAFILGGVILSASQDYLGLFLFTELQPWRITLIVMCGIMLTALVGINLIKDPREMGDRTDAIETDANSFAAQTLAEETPVGEVSIDHSASSGTGKSIISRLWEMRTTAIPLQVIRATLFIADGAVFVWGAPLFIRKFDLDPAQVGLIIGGILLGCGIISAKIGGALVDRLHRRGGARMVVRALTAIAFLCIPLSFYAVATSWVLVAILLALFMVSGLTIATGALTLITIVIPSDLRGLNLGISMVVGSLFFVGLSPLAVSLTAAGLGGPEHVDQALAIVCSVASLANALILLISIKRFSPDPADHIDG